MSRRRVRSASYRVRRQKRHANRHYFIDEPFDADYPENLEPNPYLEGARVTEYRRGRVVSIDIDPGVSL